MGDPIAGLVATTIGTGHFLDIYVQQFRGAGMLDRVEIFVIPDIKTPPSLFELCRRLRRSGAKIVCPPVEEQESYLSKLGIVDLITYNSDHRRNLGFLMALEKGCDYLISIDDDNLCLEGRSFLEDHAVVCAGTRELESVYTSTGWFNVLSLMEVTPSNVYPRGFPYRFRHLPVETCWRSEMGVVHWNSGLWLQDPDLDAATWLVSPANAQSFRGRSVVLGRDTWSPLNTQNTAIHRDAAVAFYFVRMGHALAGMPTGRWGDIFSGYLSQACMRHLGYRVRVGTPLVNHVRNRHDYLADLRIELPCIALMEDLTVCLRELRLEGNTYAEAYLSLASSLESVAEGMKGAIWDESAREFIRKMVGDMRRWTHAVGVLIGSL